MWKWTAIVLFGICSLASGYMALFAGDLGERSLFLYSAFGVLFGTLCVIFVLSLRFSRRSVFGGSGRRLSFGSGRASLISRRFVAGAVIFAGVVILAATLIPRLS